MGAKPLSQISVESTNFELSGDALLTRRVTEDAGSPSDNCAGLQRRLAGLTGSVGAQTVPCTENDPCATCAMPMTNRAFPSCPSTTCGHISKTSFKLQNFNSATRTVNPSRLAYVLFLAIGSLFHIVAANGAPISGGMPVAVPTPALSGVLTPKSFNYEFPPPNIQGAGEPLTPATRVRRTSPQNTGPAHMGWHDQPQRLYSKLGFYIDIRRNGKVKGTRKKTAWSKFCF